MKSLQTFLSEALIKTKVNSNSDYVDLGLPSGTLWCKHNLGTETETDFGLYYQWGGTEGYKDAKYHKFTTENSPYYKDGEYIKYNGKDGKTELDDKDDPVYVATNGEAKLPTKEQFEELINNTKSEWTKINGVAGRKFTGSNGNYIFFPAAGGYNDFFVSDARYRCYTWSRSLYFDNFKLACYFECNYSHTFPGNVNRYLGFPARSIINK